MKIDGPQRPPLPETIALAKRIFLANVTNAEKSILDLGSKAVERDIEKIATVLIRSSQQTEENIESQSRAPTTTIQVARLSIDRTDGSAESIVNDISRQQILVKSQSKLWSSGRSDPKMRFFRFLIPIKLEDLRDGLAERDVYSVQLEYNSREISTKLNDCADNFRSNGINFLLEDNNFDVFYSCLKNFNTLDGKQRDQTWKLLSKCMDKLYTELETFVNRTEMDAEERNNYCNLLKMIVYVFCTISELFEEQDIKRAANIDYENIGKKTNKKSKRTEESYDWQHNKERGVSVLLRLLSLPLRRVFNPPVVEDELINVITKSCYKMIENPLLSRQKESGFALNLFHIIGTSIEKYRQSLGFCLKLIQLLQHKEQLVSILALLVETVVKKHNQKLLISEIMRKQDIKRAANIDYENIGKKTNKKSKRTEESYDWQHNKERGISVLLRLLSLPLRRVFNPPVVEDELINVITKSCYKMIENPLLSRQKESGFALNLFHIIGTSIEKYRQSLGFCLKLIQLLQHKEQLVSILALLVETVVKKHNQKLLISEIMRKEQLVSILALLVETVVKKHNQKLLISEIMREIKRIDIKELSKDSSGPKAISSFLVEVSDKCPQEMLPSISDLLDFLEEDSYLMRNATLSIIGNLVIKELSKEGSKERQLRDQLLDKLEDHIHDITSYTRSRALNVWCTLCQAEAIPLPRLETLIEAVIGRLRDKSCFVRKYAIQFLNQFLTKNPFAAKLPLELLKTYHRKEDEKLKALMLLSEQNENQTSDENTNDLQQLTNTWNSIELEFVEFWTEILKTSDASYDEEGDDIENQTIVSDCDDIEPVFDRFRALITEKKFKTGLSLLKKLREEFPDNDIITHRDDEEMNESDDNENTDEEMDSEDNPNNKSKNKRQVLYCF
ncbi:unnamed protein product [Medioppia subpectinata]|uniref:Condensin complex subunit 1 N-terminal domain-containing protein n=1 Tax=Medioppia subpectinata TaxID=1979941 RepID=A0A7R9KIK2_9ACAR|nr:unnamed protein product [Medioppia subpectinata]CAG2104163.1 unnamed protein product [Medioppia subpectinata]